MITHKYLTTGNDMSQYISFSNIFQQQGTMGHSALWNITYETAITQTKAYWNDSLCVPDIMMVIPKRWSRPGLATNKNRKLKKGHQMNDLLVVE